MDVDFKIEIDSAFRIEIDTDFDSNLNRNTFNNVSESLNNSRTQTNDSQLNSVTDSDKKQFNSEIHLSKKFENSSDFVRAKIIANIYVRKTVDYIKSKTNIFDPNSVQIITDQYSDGKYKSEEIGGEFTYRIPIIANNLFLDVIYRALTIDKQKHANHIQLR
jgi:hypothetical protein